MSRHKVLDVFDVTKMNTQEKKNKRSTSVYGLDKSGKEGNEG